jgi:hypothetical protein
MCIVVIRFLEDLVDRLTKIPEDVESTFGYPAISRDLCERVCAFIHDASSHNAIHPALQLAPWHPTRPR